MTFKKGQSGNPGGRPKVLGAVVELARKHTAVAFQTLVDICVDVKAPQSARVAAANSLIERGWGKPKQEVEHEGGITINIRSFVDPEDVVKENEKE